MKNLGRYQIGLLSALFAVTALDRLVAFLDLGYSESRGRPNELRRVERPEFSVDVQLNPLGFREPRLPSTKPPGTVRIVALGDSFTQDLLPVLRRRRDDGLYFPKGWTLAPDRPRGRRRGGGDRARDQWRRNNAIDNRWRTPR